MGAIGPAAAQNVLWERRLSWVQVDAVSDVVDLGDGTLLASGTRLSFGGGTVNSSAVTLVRFTEWGDTIYCQSSGMQGATAQLCRMSSGKVYVVSIALGFFGPHHLLGRVDVETGTLLWQMVLPAFYNWAPGIFDFIEGPDESLLICGGGTDSTGISTNAGIIARYDTLGRPLWATYVRDHPQHTLLNHVEMTAQGTILASGAAGSRIFAIEFLEDGTEVRRAAFYTTPSRFVFNQYSSVRQAPGDRYLVSGMTQRSPAQVYMGMHQGWAGPALWGGETTGVLRATQVLADTGVVYFQAWLPVLALNRLRADSTRAWQRLFVNQPDQINTILYAYQFLADESALVAGSQRFRDSTDQDFYLARITNMGQPYRPWQPATAAKAKAIHPAHRPYPNPCSSTLHFTGLASPGRLELFGTDGRLHLSQAVAPGQAIDVSALPPGVYGYVLTGQGKVWRGRVVRR